jgi:hypothetical protein
VKLQAIEDSQSSVVFILDDSVILSGFGMRYLENCFLGAGVGNIAIMFPHRVELKH